MVTDINSFLRLKGSSGKEYIFDLYEFDYFPNLGESFNAISALYLFTSRYWDGESYKHELIYLGETSDLSKRFASHHKEDGIMSYGANCIGIFAFVGPEFQRKAAERDILNTYDFPCNNINN